MNEVLKEKFQIENNIQKYMNQKNQNQIKVQKLEKLIEYNEKNSLKTLKIRVTDSELITLTGGIIQGLSGSPILQNGKLVGAVTHVLIDNPQMGYGIFAESMLE